MDEKKLIRVLNAVSRARTTTWSWFYHSVPEDLKDTFHAAYAERYFGERDGRPYLTQKGKDKILESMKF